MSEEVLYRILFDGTLTGEYEIDEAKKRFAKVFRIDQRTVDQLFSGKEYVVKNNVTETMAMEYAFKIAEAGCECSYEMMPDPDDISQQPGFVERRKSVRRLRYRRPPRPGAVVPDRRKLLSRRKIDQILFEKDGDFPGNTVPSRN
jgi:hypothetical protein